MVRRAGAARMVWAIHLSGSLSFLVVTLGSAALEKSARNPAVEEYLCPAENLHLISHRLLAYVLKQEV